MFEAREKVFDKPTNKCNVLNMDLQVIVKQMLCKQLVGKLIRMIQNYK